MERDWEIHEDEALAIIGRFLEQVEKDYISPFLRFSVLTSERSYYETAEDFLLGRIAVLWGAGEDGIYLTADDMCTAIKSNLSWLLPIVFAKHRERSLEFLLGRRRKRMTRKGVSVVAYLSMSDGEEMLQLGKIFKDFGILPICASYPLPESEGKEADLEEERWDKECKASDDIEDRRLKLRRQADRSLFLLSRSNIAVFSWTGTEDRFRLTSELAHAYMLHIPIFILMEKDMPLPDEVLAFCGRFFTSLDDLALSVREVVGAGRSKIVGSFTKRKIEELLK